MAKPTSDTSETNAVEAQEGMRIKLSQVDSKWLDDMCALTGMTKSEFIAASLDVMRQKGREILAEKILSKAQAISQSLLNS